MTRAEQAAAERKSSVTQQKQRPGDMFRASPIRYPRRLDTSLHVSSVLNNPQQSASIDDTDTFALLLPRPYKRSAPLSLSLAD